nr:putative ribonuclease H-like domain-containing protein [Tanacetum cinerariifolium]
PRFLGLCWEVMEGFRGSSGSDGKAGRVGRMAGKAWQENRKPLVAETEASSSTILSKPAIKFVKATHRPTETKTDKVETAKKPAVKYAELYRKTSKSTNGNSQINIDDKGYWDSGCSQHLTGNISYLSDYEPFDGGYVSFGQGGCKITGKGIIKTGKLEFENVYFVKDLKTPRQHNMYSIDLNNVVSHKYLTCLVTKASADECMLWHRRLGKQHKASCKTKLVNSVTKPLHTLHMDLFSPTSISSLNHKWYCLVVTDDFSRVLVNKSQNKTPYELSNGRTPAIGYLKPFGCHVMILNTLDHLGKFEAKGDEGYFIGYSMSSKAFKVFNKRTKRVEENLHVDFLENKAIENGAGPNLLFDIDSLTNSMNYVPVVVTGTNSTNFSGTKEAVGQNMKKDVSSLRNIALLNWFHEAHLESSQDACNVDAPESSGNSNPTATSTNPLADHMETLAVKTLIPTVSSPISTACLNDSPELSSDTRLISKRVTSQDDTPSLDNILTLTNRFNDILEVTTNIDDSNRVEADLGNMEYNILGSPTPTFRIHKDHPKSQIIGPVDTPDPEFPARVYKVEKAMYGLHLVPRAWYGTLSKYLLTNGFQKGTIDQTLFIIRQRGDFILVQVYVDDIIFRSLNPQLCREFEALMHEKFQMSAMGELNFFLGLQVLQKKDGIFLSQDKYVVETPIPTVSSPVSTACLNDSSGLSSDTRLISKRVTSQNDMPSLDNILTLTNRFEDILGVTTNTNDSNGVEADFGNMEYNISASPNPTFRIHKDHPKRVRPIGTKWVLKNKKDERGKVIRNKARLVAQGHTHEKGIDYDEVFVHVARIKAIRLFLAYASFMRFTVYQMDMKSTFLYGTIDEEVYAPRAWYGTLSKYLLTNGFQRGTIDQTLFIRRQRGYFILVQVYVDDIIFRSSNPQLCREFEALMHEKFQMSDMGDLNFFLGLQVLQKKDGIFLSQDKYGQDRTGKDVELHLYRSMIGSLMYLTASRPDIMFVVYTCARHQVTPKECHLHAVKRIFRYLKGHPKLGLWYPKESPFDLVAYSDSDYGGATQDRKSTTRGHHFIRDCFEKKLISVDHIHTDANVADLLTKPFNAGRFYYLVIKHAMRSLVSWNYIIYTAIIVDFVEAFLLRYALTINPTIYVFHIRQFWSTARIKTTDEGTKILATVDGKPRTISKSSIRRNLKLRDEAGISSLSDAELFKNLTLMGYNILPNQKFSFQKGQLSHQWKYLIHTIMQCLRPKSTGFNEFNSNIATALVCLATNRVYNFSKMIFDGMVRNVNNKVSKFLMYPRVNSPSFSRRIVPLFPTMLVTMGEGSGTPTEPHHTPSTEAQQTLPTATSSPSLLPVTTATIPTVITTDTPQLRQYTRRARIAQSSTLPPVADEHVSLIGDDSQGEAYPTVSGLEAEQDRANITKTSTLPSDSTPRVTSLAADEGSIEDSTIKGRRLETGEEVGIESSTEKGSDDTKEMVNVLTSLDATSVLSSGVQVSVPPAAEVATISIPPAGEIHPISVPTGSGVVPTASPIFTTATVATPYTRRKGKEKMVESETPKKKKLQEKIDVEMAGKLEEEMARDAQRMNEQIARDSEIARIHAEEELQIMIDGLDRNNETVAKYLQEYHQFAAELPIERRIELISDLVKYQDNYTKVLKHFKGMTLEEIKENFDPVWKQIEDFIPIGSKKEGERFKRKGLRLEQDSAKKVKTLEKFSEEDLKDMMEDLNQLWALVKETLNIRQAANDKE